MDNSTLIYILLFIIFLGFAFWFFVRYMKYRAAQESGAAFVGGQIYPVGSNLDLIIFVITAIAPLVAIYSITKNLVTVEEVASFKPTSVWSDYKFYFVSILVCLQLAYWWVAYGLAFRFVPESARNAKFVIMATPFVRVVMYFLEKAYLGQSSVANTLIGFIFLFLCSAVCLFYFTLSTEFNDLYYYDDESPEAGNITGRRPRPGRKQNNGATGEGAAEVIEFKLPNRKYIEFKKCPFCAEDIRTDAVKCRYCLSELETAG